MINEVNPDFVRVRTAAIKHGTELYRDWQDGLFELCGDDDKVREIRRVIELTGGTQGEQRSGIGTYLVSDHMINLLQDIEGYLGRGGGVTDDRVRMLARIDEYLGMPEDRRRVFQLLRRTLRAYSLDDMRTISDVQLRQLCADVMKENELGWNVRMNGYICRYV